MKEGIYEIIATIIILGLIITGIQLCRNDVKIVGTMAQNTDNIEKVTKEEIIGINELVTGGDVISFIRYYSTYPDVEISINLSSSSKKYTTETYNSSKFKIPYDSYFEINVVRYEDGSVKKIICNEK